MAEKKEEENKNREALLLERKKIIFNLVLFSTAAVVVLIGVLTMAWFANNKKSNGTSMSVTVEIPEDMQISIGRTNNEYLLNDTRDYFLLVTAAEAAASDSGLTEGEVHPPRETGTDSMYDWSDHIDISNYYKFGRLMPASSDSGKDIFFTPDSFERGKNVKDGARYFLASGSKTDKNLKDYLGSTTNPMVCASESSDVTDFLRTTAKPLVSGDSKEGTYWSGTNPYRKSKFWYDTNDDGYYIDIPVWLRSNCAENVNLCVEGIVTNNAGAAPDDVAGTYWLYKATRVAILKEENGLLVTAIPPANVDEETIEKNILNLQNSTTFGITNKSILDSENFRTTRQTVDMAAGFYGMRAGTLDSAYGIKQSDNYKKYEAYNGTASIVSLSAVSSGYSWGAAQKLIIRIWIDGEDGDCWNPSANQDWNIRLKFKRIN